jgi:CRP-like cAMP-binding protein
MPLFAALPAPAMEGIARALEPRELRAGAVLIRQGDVGDRFYAIADGEVEVRLHGEVLRRLGRGAGVGEIALLQDVPRTADVVAVTDVRLYALEKEPFLAVVTGHPPTNRAARALVSLRRPDLAEHAAGDEPAAAST